MEGRGWDMSRPKRFNTNLVHAVNGGLDWRSMSCISIYLSRISIDSPTQA